MRLRAALAAALWLVACAPVAAQEGSVSSPLVQKLCAALADRVDAVPGDAPLFLRSYDGASGQGPIDEPALATAAFTYDNALATIALTACHRPRQALRIGRALLAAATHDRAGGGEGRMRNTYRAGPITIPPPPNGWWDAGRGLWMEDAYQTGSATGNLAWAALALLTLAEQSGETAFRDGAAVLGRWAVTHTASMTGPGGFTGGLHGDGAALQPLTWKATEHNMDLLAVFLWLQRSGAPGDWAGPAAAARRFVDAQWDAAGGYFLTGTQPDGVTPNRGFSALDIQLWSLLLPEAPADWRRGLAYAERTHGVEGGFDFNDDRDGLWVEGTAQAALAYRVAGRPEEARRVLGELAREVSPGGYLWATRRPFITTGLSIGPDSRSADFFYYRRPHLGATAWGVLAALGWNPYRGRPVE